MSRSGEVDIGLKGNFDRASALGLDVGELSYKKNESITYEKLIKLLYNVRNQTSWGKSSSTVKSTSSTTKSTEDPLKKARRYYGKLISTGILY